MYDPNAFHKIIDKLIRLNLELRKDFKKELKEMGSLVYAKEFGTVHCNIGRRTGKTEYIKSRATKKDLVIVPVHRWVKALYGDVIEKTNIHSAIDFIDCGIWQVFHQKIYIDEPAMIDPKMMETFYKYLWKGWDYPNQIFILLGK